MRRIKFIFPMLLFAGACDAPAVVGPAASVEDPSSTIVAVDSTWTSNATADSTPQRGEGGIMIGSGT
jgi:hypothetical protein